jgi:hypothetical protein
MNGVQPNDLDELGVVILAGLKGMDITSHWLGRDNLEQWGLDWRPWDNQLLCVIEIYPRDREITLMW